jgi:two-component system chemotaxis sensor kinase CheA
MSDMSKYVDLFVEEAQEHLQAFNQVLLDLEKNGYDKKLMNSAYRTVHTIKGSASVLGIDAIGDLAHVAEDLFDLLKENEDTLTEELLDLLFRTSDLFETMIQELSKSKKVNASGQEIINQMQELLKESGSKESTRKKNREGKGEVKGKQKLAFALSQEQKDQVMETLSDGSNIYEVDITLNENTRFKEGRVFQLLRNLSSTGFVIASTPDTKDIDDSISEVKLLLATNKKQKAIAKVIEDVTGIAEHKITSLDLAGNAISNKKPESGMGDIKSNESKQAAGLMKSDTIRVKSRLLDQLLDLVGEIMINNIRVKQIAIDLKHRELRQVLKNAERLIEELQDTVLRMRMVPVDHIFKRFPRMVRDMAKEEGKEIDFEILGNDIEIDRSLLDQIGDALVHLLRNAVDHGIESEDERKKQKKKPRGHVLLSAFHEQSNIVITVEDDGKGINTEHIIEKALDKEVITQEETENLDEKDVFQLAFLPGVSTASKVTEISGRGVGLDAVKDKIEALGGTVKLESQEGRGTKFTMKLPPSMSIISAMLVEINGENYAIPLENVSETTKVSMEEVHEFAKSGMFRLREEILPLLNVHTEFGGDYGAFKEELPVIIVEKDENRSGLIVSRFIGQQEIVVKNLTRDLRQAQYFSGATILGDGNVALILDVGTLM